MLRPYNYVDRRSVHKPSEHLYQQHTRKHHHRPKVESKSGLESWKICLLFLFLFVFLAVLGIGIGVPVGLKLSEKYCPALTVPENGQLVIGQLIRNEKGMAAVMKCNRGYYFTANTPSGANKNLICQNDGTWSEEVGDCLASKCPDVEFPANSYPSAGNAFDNKYDDSLTITCSDGYAFRDGTKSRTFTCRQDGQWDKSFDECMSHRCPDIFLPRYTNLTSGVMKDNMYRNEVTVTAIDGYMFSMNGDTPVTEATITCQDDGTWDQELQEPTGIPVDGVWGEWGDWSTYNPCTPGERTRTRECNDPAPLFGGEPCPGDDSQTEATIVEPQCVTIFATLEGDFGTSAGKISFDPVVSEKPTGQFVENIFTAEAAGTYMFGLTAGRKAHQTLQLDLAYDDAGTEVEDGVLQCKMANTVDGGSMYVQNRHFIRKLAVGEERYVSCPDTYGGSGGDAEDAYTSFSVFSISGLFDPVVAFEAGIDVTAEKAGSLFSNSKVVVNDGNGFDGTTGVFTAPYDGLYFLSVKGWQHYDYSPSGCTISEDEASFSVLSSCNGECPGYVPITFEYEQLECEGYKDPIGRSVIYDLKAGDEITFVNSGPGPQSVHGTEDLQTAMNGFLYSPTTVDPVAFCAFYLGDPFEVIEEWTDDTSTYTIELPAQFDTILINVGGDFIDHFFDCTKPGLYFIYFSSGHIKTKNTDLYLSKNRSPIAGLYASGDRTGRDHGLLGRSVVVELAKDDRLEVMMKGGSFFGNNQSGENRASFMGILLQPPV